MELWAGWRRAPRAEPRGERCLLGRSPEAERVRCVARGTFRHEEGAAKGAHRAARLMPKQFPDGQLYAGLQGLWLDSAVGQIFYAERAVVRGYSEMFRTTVTV